MDANRAEAQRCVDIARQHLAQGNADKAKKFLLKARKLHHEVDVDDLLRKVNGEGGGGGMGSKSEEGGASSEEHPTANGYAHFDHYNDPSNLRSRRGKFNSSQSQPSFGQDNAGQSSSSTTANGSASKEKAKAKPKANRSRTRSADGTPKLGVDFTQEEYDIVQRIRHCKDYYEILNVKKDATEAQLKKEYRKLALQLHPDKCRAPHSTEAFKALGNAYAVLSDTEKRQRYDMYGADQVQSQPRRRQSEFYEYDFGRGFEAEFTPEEIFNMFFGGGYPSGAMNRRRGGGGGTFHYQQQHAHQQPEPGYGPLIQLIPLLAIFVLGIIGQLMVGEPAYSLHRTNKYVEERHTADLRVSYFVKPDFVQNYRGRIQQIEHQVEDEYVSNLRMGCYRERSQKETMAWRARTFGDSQLWEKSQNMPTPNCNRLQELYG